MRSSFRARLTLRWTLAFGLLLGTANMTVWIGARTLAYRDLDAQVRTLAGTELASALDEWRGPHVHEFPVDSLGKGEFAGKVSQVTTAEGRVLASTKGIPDDVAFLDDAMRLAALAGEAPTATIHVGDRPVRVAALSSTHEGETYVLVVGTYAEGTEASLQHLAWLLGVVWVLALGLTAAVGYVLASRALAPVDQIMQRAARIARGDLAARLGPPLVDDEIGRMITLLNEMLDRQHATIEANRRFAADASHELRSPLTALLGEIDVALKRERSPEDYRETLVLLRDRLQEMSRLADDLMVLVRAEEGGAEGRVEEVALRPLVLASLARSESAARARGIALEVDGMPDLVAYGDPRLLARAIDNLVANAVKYDRDGGRVTVSGGCIAATPEAWAPGRVWLHVRDTGPGIAREEWERVFERFYRLDRSRSRRTGGSGLGLAICRAVVGLSGGEVRILQSSPQGTTFEVVLPGASSSSAEEASTGTVAPSPGDPRHAAATAPRAGAAGPAPVVDSAAPLR